MKKIIAAFDGLDFSDSTLNYTLFMAKYCNAHIVGIFLDDVNYHSYSLREVIAEGGGITDNRIKELNTSDTVVRDNAVVLFEDACQQAGLNYSVHRDRNVAVQELLHESIYADLLIVDSKETFTRFEEQRPTQFIRELLTDVQCPVLLVPQKFQPIEKVLMLYDGEPSSVFAAKTFSYLFPALKHLPTSVLVVKTEKQTLHLPDNRLMKEFLKRHFPKAEIDVLKGEVEETILTTLKQQNEEVLVVLGAYRRSRVSRWFKQSMADVLMINVKFPLFIAHN
jgi:hypothetical protein